jgi:hypothetical protein
MDTIQPENNLKTERPAWWKVLIICIVSALANTTLSYIVSSMAGLPLYLDTVFTAAAVFSAGLLPGLLIALVLCPMFPFLRHHFLLNQPVTMAFTENLFAICTVMEVILVFLFLKKIREREAQVAERKPSLQSFIGMAPLLLTLAALDCIVISITGGIIDFILTQNSTPRPFFPEDTFKLGLLRNNVPLLTSAILSRIPINIVDRFFVIFGGYGISLAYRKWLAPRHEAE